MTRSKIEIPAFFLFETCIKVRISDINYGNHLGHDSLISMLHEARVEFLKSYDFTELNVFGRGLILAEILVQYRSEVFHGEELIIKLLPRNLESKTFEIVYQVSEKTSSREVARATTQMVWFDYKARKAANMPEKIADLWVKN